MVCLIRQLDNNNNNNNNNNSNNTPNAQFLKDNAQT